MDKNIEVLRGLVAFLNGEAPLDGCWFGEDPPPGKGSYWWRKHLNAALAALSAQAEAQAVANRDAVAKAIWLATKAYGSFDHDRPSLSAEPRPLQKLIYEQADAAILAMQTTAPSAVPAEGWQSNGASMLGRPTPSIAEGFAVVPEIATEEMVEAIIDQGRQDGDEISHTTAHMIWANAVIAWQYRAVRAAAPEPKE